MPFLPWPKIVFKFPRNPLSLLWCLLTTISLTVILARSDSSSTCRSTNQNTSTPSLSTNSNFNMDALAHDLHVAPNEHFVHDVPGTYPRLCRLADGSILAGFTTFEPDGQRVLTVARSTDDAKSFDPHGEVARSAGDCDNMFLLQLPPSPDGDDSEATDPPILAAFRNHDLDDEGNPSWFRITVCRSTDGGRSWSFLSQAFEKPAPYGLWEPFLRLARGGEVQLYFSQEVDEDDQDTMVIRSTDGGETWSAPSCVTGGEETLRDGMVGVVETQLEPGVPALVMVLETTRLTTYSIEAVVSFDDGETFGDRQVVYAPEEGKNAGGPQIAVLHDGHTLVIVFMTDEDGDGDVEAGWPQGGKIKAMGGTLQEDRRLALGAPVVVGETASSWPAIIALSDNSALAVFDAMGIITGRLLTTPASYAD
ncbi:glycoside hydrolase family 93 protein [Parathielavia hyrcaniae]|uniref:Glycoside hydrolase family 93 protein n=1 Tax=Parathielavia hyrcaniae TaxID=113614 RepID=A0AAN6PUH8_9PEZI|nr:glycoside hydrolase family 93 protein [Parathielavia hyrcaniae]